MRVRQVREGAGYFRFILLAQLFASKRVNAGRIKPVMIENYDRFVRKECIRSAIVHVIAGLTYLSTTFPTEKKYYFRTVGRTLNLGL